MTRLHELSLVETGRALASGETTSPQVVAALLERIAALNAQLNALITVMADAAQEGAAAAHRRPGKSVWRIMVFFSSMNCQSLTAAYSKSCASRWNRATSLFPGRHGRPIFRRVFSWLPP